MQLKHKLNLEKILDLSVKSWVSYLFFVFLVTEFLSLFNLINRTSIIIVYSVLALLISAFLFKNKIRVNFDFLKNIEARDKFILLLIILTILLPILFTALYYPPNTWDSMSYHMARILHWIDNQNVNFYFTQNDRQLFSGPLAEYVILHWYLLVDSDILSNLVQFFSLLVTTSAVYLISKLLSKDKKSNLLSIVLVLTAPMAIMQASSTQNDLVVSSILLSTIYLGFKKSWILFGLSIGLGMLTKNTYAIFALPFCLFFGIAWLKEYKQKAIWLFLWFLTCVVFINSMHWYRNFQEFASPVGPNTTLEDFLNSEHSLKIVFSNMIKGLALQINLPNHEYNSLIDRIVYQAHQKMNFSINDPRSSWSSTVYETQFLISEDIVGNFYLTIVLIFSFFLVFKKGQSRHYGFSLIGGWLFYNYLLKWQPWGNRLLMPLLMAAVPYAAVEIQKFFVNKKLQLLIILLLIISTWPFIANNGTYFGKFETRVSPNRQFLPLPEFGKKNRIERYFLGARLRYDNLMIAKKMIDQNDHVENVCLNLAYDSWEYTWWLLKKITNKSNLKINVLKDESKLNCDLTISTIPDYVCDPDFRQIHYEYFSICIL